MDAAASCIPVEAPCLVPPRRGKQCPRLYFSFGTFPVEGPVPIPESQSSYPISFWIRSVRLSLPVIFSIRGRLDPSFSHTTRHDTTPSPPSLDVDSEQPTCSCPRASTHILSFTAPRYYDRHIPRLDPSFRLLQTFSVHQCHCIEPRIGQLDNRIQTSDATSDHFISSFDSGCVHRIDLHPRIASRDLAGM